MKSFSLPVFAFLPNTDLGGEAIARTLRSLRKGLRFHVVPNLPRPLYLSLLKSASVLVGNSSSGIIDAPCFKIPVVDIGHRQDGRETSVNVLHAAADRASIEKALRKALSPQFHRIVRSSCRNVYGDGRASGRMARLLATIAWGPRWIQKQLEYA